ncbi:diphthine--ammonia ligase [Candidatus Woesearchaeota archaeon]|nr:diphthine--ammonia ligase [Candidatus Woesearchaeota archaeon]
MNEEHNKKAVALWSGGKDGCMACFKAMNSGYSVEYLLNFILKGSNRSISHQLNKDVLVKQSEALGIKLIQEESEWEKGEEIYIKTFSHLKKQGVDYAIFGDIFLKEHYDWLKRVSIASGLIPVFPLWGLKTENIITELLDKGFETVIINLKYDLFGEEWLGEKISQEFIDYLTKNGLDPCGEYGEYHTFVTGGPIFNKNVEITKSVKSIKNNPHKIRTLDILECRLVKK